MRPRRRRAVLSVLVALVTVVTAVMGRAIKVDAGYVPYGSVLVSGPSWAGGDAAYGDLNVYSNGTGSQDQIGRFGLNYECVELAARWAALRFGDPNWTWGVSYAYQMWAAGPRLPVPFLQHPNGGADGPQYGDIMVFAATSFDPSGHVAVVSATGPGWVSVVEQNYANYNPTGTAKLPISGTSMPNRWGLPILGWLRSVTAPNGWRSQAGPGGYVTDSTGHVYPYGSAPFASEQTIWPTQATARAIVRVPHTNGGYVLDSYGGLHNFGGAPRVRYSPGAYWFGLDVARDVVLTPDGKGGYVLDAFGGVHAFGSALPLTSTGSWPGWDIARALVLRSDGAGGWVLDAWGGLHSFGTVPNVRMNSAYFPGQDTGRGLCLRSDGTSGWWVDAANDLHSFGGAPPVTSTADFPGQDVARGIVCNSDDGGYTVTDYGHVREFGTAPAVYPAQNFNAPTVQGIAA